MSISSSRDFRYEEGREDSPEVVIDDPQLTLYCLDAKRQEAVFVETEPGVDLSADPFYYQAQYRHAHAAVVMPIESMHAAARAKGDRFEQAVMVHSVGRCGSTLLSKMFNRLPECLSLSEPDVYTQLLTDGLAASSIEPLLESTTRHYYQPATGQRPSHLAVKFRSFCVELAEAMQRATPRSIPIFLYRDVERVIRSGMRVFCYRGAPLWWFDQLHAWLVTRPALAFGLWWNRSLGQRLFPVLERFTTWELTQLGPVGILAIAWVSAMERCVAAGQGGLDILPIRYDDLIGPAKEATIAALLEHCRLPATGADAMLQALDEDSQAGSVIERRRQRSYELTSRDRDVIRMVLARSDVIDSGAYQILGTAAMKGS